MFSFTMPSRDIILVASGFMPIKEETESETEAETEETSESPDDTYYVFDGEIFSKEPELTDKEAEEYVDAYKEYVNGDLSEDELSNSIATQNSNNGISVYSASDIATYAATQVMVWIIEKGWYTYNNNTFALTTDGQNADSASSTNAEADGTKSSETGGEESSLADF